MSSSPEGDWTTTVLPCGHEVLDAGQVHYCDYISLDALLALTRPYAMNPDKARDPAHHDEYQFVVVHQISELHFFMALKSLVRAIELLDQDQIKDATRLLHRSRRYVEAMGVALTPLLTMTPEDFKEFRPLLLPASGMESILYRLLEIYAGLREDSPYAHMHGRDLSYRQFLDRKPVPGEVPGRAKTRIWTQNMDKACAERSFAIAIEDAAARHGLEEAADILTPSNREHALYDIALEFIVFENAFQDVRRRHVAIARSQIGDEMGTGHTTGVRYLKSVIDTARFHPKLRAAWKAHKSSQDTKGAW